tara:strand:+ start:2298 stop:3347 length:1050 start_codon:yes stop_codon:yes gene_type:complete
VKALVFNNPRDVRYESFDDPERTTSNGAIVNVKQCSICGSDLHIYHGDHIGSNDYGSGVEKFCVGHEFTGEVVDVGPDVRGIKVGDKVLASGGAGCGNCEACQTGNSSKCQLASAFGLSNALNGGQAEFVHVPNADATLMRIPEGVSEDQAILLTDAAATAYFGTSNADIKPGRTVAVVGLGPIGLIGIELAFIMGAAEVFAIDPVEERRTRATALGATTFAPGDAAHAAIAEATKGAGVTSVFEASGVKAAVDSAVGLVARGGTLSFIGLPQPNVVLPMMALLYKNITVRAGVAPVPQLWAPLVPLFQQGRLKADNLFTHRMPLSKGADAYEMFDAKADGVVKIMMTV